MTFSNCITRPFLAVFLSLVSGVVEGLPDMPDTRFVYVICNAGTHYGSFNQSLSETLYQVKEGTAYHRFNYYYESPQPGPTPICYGHGQCNSQIWYGYCTECLRVAADRILEECPSKIGGQIQLADCRIRYEKYEFNED